MNKLKAGLLAVGGIGIGIVTLRRLRKRRSLPDETHDAAESASEHAAAAADHARIAGEKTVDVVRTELDTNGTPVDAQAPAGGRLDRVKQGLIRR